MLARLARPIQKEKVVNFLRYTPFKLLGSGSSFQIIALNWQHPKKCGHIFFKKKNKIVFCISQKIIVLILNLILFPCKFHKKFDT